MILVDLSAEYAGAGEAPAGLLHVEREIGRRLLDDSSLKTLPVVLHNDLIYVLDDRFAAAVLTSGLTRADVSAPTAASDRPRRGVPRLVQQVASSVGRRAINLAPERARPEARQSLLHARHALAATLRPPRSQQLPVASPEIERLSTIVRPTKGHIVWTCGLHCDGAPLRHLAEAKMTAGFRVASICYGVNDSEWDRPIIATDVLATRLTDLLDASDVVFCASGDVRDELERCAVERGRPAPNVRLLPLEDGWDATVTAVRAGISALARDEKGTHI